MSAFTHSFNQGFKFGMLTNMFGGGWCNPFMNNYAMGFNPFGGFCNPFNSLFCCHNSYIGWNPASLYMVPRYDFNNFYSYQTPSLQAPTVWDVSTPNFSSTPSWNNNFNYPIPNYLSQNLGVKEIIGDSFISTTSTTESRIKTEKNDIDVEETQSKEELKDVSKSDNKISCNAQELKTKWNNRYQETKHLTNEFFEKVVTISKELECDPNDLMAVINLETAGSFRASVQNKKSRATGLIQFMPQTAVNMNTSIDALAKMSEVDQLDYVKKYLQDRKKEKGIKGQIDATTLYCLVFWPAAANKNDSYEIANNKNNNVKTYNWNKGLDYNNDKSITRGDLGKRVQEFMA